MLRIFWLSLALALGGIAVSLVGCGGSKAGPEAAVTPAEAAPVVDNRPPGERLRGEWVGTMVFDQEGVKDLSPQQLAAAQKARLGIAFDTDGTMLEWDPNNDQSPDVPGNWQLLKHEGDNVTIKSLSSTGKQKEIVIMFEGPDHFLMPLKTEVANLGAMRFERMR